MKILAIDTSSKICSVAIVENENVIDELNIDDGKTHSENLMPLVNEIFKNNNIELKDLDFIACCVGPGSFTGIRIGVASIKPIAEVLNIKVASVTSLETLAKNVEKSETIISLVDARNNQVYCGVFDNNYNLKQDYIADDINVVIDNIKKYNDITLVGDGAILHRELLESKINGLRFADNNVQTASNVAKIGYKKYLENKLMTADDIIPTYLRKSQAERLKK